MNREQLGLFDDDAGFDPDSVRAVPGLRIAFGEAELEALAGALIRADAPAVASALLRGKLLGLLLCPDGLDVWLAVADGDGRIPPQIAAAMRNARVLLGHDIKRQRHAWADAGLTLHTPVWDVMVAAHLCSLPTSDLGMEDLLARQQRPARSAFVEEESELPAAAEPKTAHDAVLQAARHAAQLHALRADLLAHMNAEGVTRLFYGVEMPLLHTLWEMERDGVAIDTAHMAAMSRALAESMADIEQKVFAYSKRPFNIESPQQLARVLFEDLKLPTDKLWRTRGGALSTSSWQLDDLKDKHPIVPLALEHRELAKLKGTYCDALPAALSPVDGRLHCTFNQVNTVTGRLSSTNPNLQSVPIVSEMGRRVRQGFVGAPGNLVISADYSQVELRILAHLADEPALIAAFERDEDIHKRTAAQINGIAIEQVTADQRAYAKRINFGLAYGMGANSLASGTGMTLQQARAFIDRYFRGFPRVYDWIEHNKREARSKGFIVTLMGRKRPIPEYRREGAEARARGDRLAINTIVQGSAADILKIAMTRLQARLRADGLRTRMVLTVHDELVFDTPEAEVAAASAVIREVMCNAVPLKARLAVDLHVGKSWD